MNLKTSETIKNRQIAKITARENYHFYSILLWHHGMLNDIVFPNFRKLKISFFLFILKTCVWECFMEYNILTGNMSNFHVPIVYFSYLLTMHFKLKMFWFYDIKFPLNVTSFVVIQWARLSMGHLTLGIFYAISLWYLIKSISVFYVSFNVFSSNLGMTKFLYYLKF